jgi:mannosyl-3-phosphoglycerate phosphatase
MPSVKKKSAVVITDLDGTLLSSVNYSYKEALPALEALRERQIPVVLVSSKTRTEIEVLRRELGLNHPFVVENGGAAYWPASYFSEPGIPVESVGPYELVRWGVSYPELVAALREARQETGANVRGYSDVGVEEVAERTSLGTDEARRSMEREFDEPFWFPEEEGEREQKLLDWLESKGYTLTRGGRFFHIMGGCDKGRAVRELLKLYHCGGESCSSAGLGDARNDLPFLQVVDRPYIVARENGRHDPSLTQAVPKAVCVAPAPKGWADAVEDFLSWLDRP